MINHYQQLVTKNIPITEHMEWNIILLSSTEIQTVTQLTPNINVHGTAYAGSIYAAAMATGWTLLKCWYDTHQFDAELVAAEANIKYLQPIPDDFECNAQIDVNESSYTKLFKRLSNQQSCSYPLKIKINCKGETCAILEVNFVFKCH